MNQQTEILIQEAIEMAHDIRSRGIAPQFIADLLDRLAKELSRVVDENLL